MYFQKIPHPANFTFAAGADPATGTLPLGDAAATLRVTPLGGDVHRLTLTHERWSPHGSHAVLAERIEGQGDTAHTVALTSEGMLAVTENTTGQLLLRGVRRATFGACGRTWLVQFAHEPDMQFYGLGEHSKGLEKSGQRVKFWNTDLFGDFAHCEIHEGYANPMYVAIPWLIVKRGNTYLGLLVHNPGAVFMDLASNFVWSEANQEDRTRASFYVGAPEGQPELFLIVGPSLPALTRKLQALVGRTPLPPLWALGHHQCRWGYAGPHDLAALDRGFRQHGIPCDGLWLDIDYMDSYRVFTFAPEHWRDRAHVQRILTALARRGRRVVPILDPGVKAEPDFSVAQDGMQAGVFCLNPEGRPYVGFVWPGKTYLPDFSLAEARAWWAAHVAELARLGFAGMWIDMNDPSVGAVELDDMRFGRGTQPHASYHNQYGLGMAQATQAGLLSARPDTRPFILTRSACASSARYAAVWTGDNVANWHHLRLTIPLSLGLALSGAPFNGPDVCGFMTDTTPELATAWYKAGFLFPFLRNHSTAGTRAQEPWALGAAAGRTIGHYIRLRYKLLPYLYQLFVAQEETGDAILRPLFHDFADTPAQPLGTIADQFLVGPAILQAPIVQEGATTRTVVLPGAQRWFSTQNGQWLDGRQTVDVSAGADETPLFVREGSLVPMQPGERRETKNDLTTIELHCFVRRTTREPATLRYVCDDGESFAYQRGARTSFVVEATAEADGSLRVTVRDVRAGYRPVRVCFVVYDSFTRVLFASEGAARPRELALTPHRWRCTGKPLSARLTPSVRVGAPTAKISPAPRKQPRRLTADLPAAR